MINTLTLTLIFLAFILALALKLILEIKILVSEKRIKVYLYELIIFSVSTVKLVRFIYRLSKRKKVRETARRQVADYSGLIKDINFENIKILFRNQTEHPFEYITYSLIANYNQLRRNNYIDGPEITLKRYRGDFMVDVAVKIRINLANLFFNYLEIRRIHRGQQTAV